jgi:maleylacetate reductase
MPLPFVYEAQLARVLFGAGTSARLPDEVERLGLQSLPGERAAGTLLGATAHTPVEATERALAVVCDLKIDGVVSAGGKSTTGLGKPIALRTDLPQLVLPKRGD